MFLRACEFTQAGALGATLQVQAAPIFSELQGSNPIPLIILT